MSNFGIPPNSKSWSAEPVKPVLDPAVEMLQIKTQHRWFHPPSLSRSVISIDMEAPTLFKFWRKIVGKKAELTAEEMFDDGDDDDDAGSFFELELSLPELNAVDDGRRSSVKGLCLKDLIFNNRVLPIEPELKSSSSAPVTKSSSKFKAFALGLKRSRSQRTEKTEKPERVEMKKLFTGKSGHKEPISRGRFSTSEESRRFSKDVIQKYFSMIKPRSSKGCVEKSKTFRKEQQALGKSRSASAVETVVGGRRYESLRDLDDGIQSAIQHCKRSFSASRDSCRGRVMEGETEEKRGPRPVLLMNSFLQGGKVVG